MIDIRVQDENGLVDKEFGDPDALYPLLRLGGSER